MIDATGCEPTLSHVTAPRCSDWREPEVCKSRIPDRQGRNRAVSTLRRLAPVRVFTYCQRSAGRRGAVDRHRPPLPRLAQGLVHHLDGGGTPSPNPPWSEQVTAGQGGAPAAEQPQCPRPSEPARANFDEMAPRRRASPSLVVTRAGWPARRLVPVVRAIREGAQLPQAGPAAAPPGPAGRSRYGPCRPPWPPAGGPRGRN